MPVYSYPTTPLAIETTLPNDIRAGNPNPNVEPVLEAGSVWIEQDRLLRAPVTMPDGEAANYARPYYQNVFSAPTTAGYTNMRQVTFTRYTGMITGYQWGVPTIR